MIWSVEYRDKLILAVDMLLNTMTIKRGVIFLCLFIRTMKLTMHVESTFFSEFGGITDTIISHICSSCPLWVVHIFTNLTYSDNAMFNKFT